MILTPEFFNRPTLEICPELLGKFLVRSVGSKQLSGMVTEVEAYVGMEDKACHAAKGKTPRNSTLFEEAGHWYVYLCYGMYWMLNIVTEQKDFPAAILIRGIHLDAPLDAGRSDEKHLNGPGKLTKNLGIDKKFNRKLATPQTGLWFEDRGIQIPTQQIKQGKRIGINYAGAWKHKPWRFYLTFVHKSQTIMEYV